MTPRHSDGRERKLTEHMQRETDHSLRLKAIELTFATTVMAIIVLSILTFFEPTMEYVFPLGFFGFFAVLGAWASKHSWDKVKKGPVDPEETLREGRRASRRHLVSRARHGDVSGIHTVPVAVEISDILRRKEVRALQLEESLDSCVVIEHDVDVALNQLTGGVSCKDEFYALGPGRASATADSSVVSRAFLECLFNSEAPHNTVRVDHVITIGKRSVAVALRTWGGRFRPGSKGKLFECEENPVDVVRLRAESVNTLIAASRAIDADNPLALLIIDGGVVDGGSITVPLKDGSLVVAEFDAAVSLLRSL
ncbi:hypothetical protein [Corynebacterium aquatimens]|uniref:Uncharacterized protein n=1 Tax=Corynebacterium aquatimens TaxID=1190508 RepID=A0A931GT57_9CORY|nr:hypothetical protein [Corynebacterium aquatimens]MBG6121515.1 hypothetical protein [Corynebacterium aquatimens]